MTNDRKTATPLHEHLAWLRLQRRARRSVHQRLRSKRMSAAERDAILSKTDGKCHICGGRVGRSWSADHVLAHSAGGAGSADNFPPAHDTCNNYRWDYLPEEFELILKLGVWSRTQIENQTKVGRAIEESFVRHELRRVRRRQGSG